jgi:peptidyl-prolyl cis-trans isomerase C
MNAHKPVRCILPMLGMLLLVAACPSQKKSGTPEGEPTSSKNPNANLPVATIGDSKITVGMLEDELNKQNPYLRMRFSSPERRKEFLKNLVRFEVLAGEAKRRGLETDPEVVRRVKRAMIDRMMEELQNTLVKMESITDKDVADFYQTNLAQYQQPAKVRASWIVLASAAEAQKVLAEAKTKPTDVAFFGELAKKHSIEEAAKSNRGDLDFFTHDATNVPKEIVEAAFAIPALWQMAGPVKTAKGFAVVMKTGELQAVNHPLESEKDRIKSRIYNERRMKAVEGFIDDLQAKAKVAIDDKALEKVKVDLSAKSPAGFQGRPGGFHGGLGGFGPRPRPHGLQPPLGGGAPVPPRGGPLPH